MNPAKHKIILGCLTILFFLSAAFLVVRFSPHIGTEPDFFSPIVGLLMGAFNLAILTGCLAFGWIGGVVILALSSFVVALLSEVYEIRAFYLNLPCFIVSIVFGYSYTKAIFTQNQLYKVDIEELEEKINTVNIELEKRVLQNEAFKKKLTRYAALKDVAECLSSSLSLDDTLSLINESLHKLIPKADRTLLYLADVGNQELMLKSSRLPDHFPKPKSKKGDIYDRWVFRQKTPLSVLDVEKDFRFSQEDVKKRESAYRSLILHPLTAGNNFIGLLHMDSLRPENLIPDDLRLLGIISYMGAVAVENALLYERTQKLAIRDSLTNLFVYRYFMERLDAELERAFMGNYNVSLLMIDLDHFKDYNDKYGHTAGDILLVRMSEIFTKSVNPGDLVCRYGGEEFAILLFETDKRDAHAIADRIRTDIEKEKFWLRREATSATVSIGVATFPIDARGKTEFINIADRNLYKAKGEGRNRVC